jgi:Zn-dependent protease/CBS domain-containing protein
MKRNIHVGKYLGIDVYLHYSWFLIFLLLAWALATGFFPQRWPGHAASAYWIMGVLSSILLFVSVLLHELSHSVVANRHGMKVDRITLFFFGGMASTHEKHISPKREFQMAIAGPAMSLLISGVSLAVYNITGIFYIAAIANYLFRINLILAIFNLVPGFPLDGGRILRSIIWYWTKDFSKATKIASNGGRIVAYILIFMGIASIFAGNFGGVWIILIGVFLLTLSTLSHDQIEIKDALHNVSAGDFADKKFKHVSPGTTVKEARKYLMNREFILVLQDGKLAGAITQEAAVKEKRKTAKAKDIMILPKYIVKVLITTTSYNALIKMMKKGALFAAIIDKDKVVGIIKRDNIIRYAKYKTVKAKYGKMGFKVN